MNDREIIMEHYQHPLNRKKNDDPMYLHVNTRNESCIDNIDLYVKFNDNIIEDITFMGEACAISISATSIMIKNLIGKTCEEALNYIREFYKMTNGEEFNENILKEGCAYSDVARQGHRKTCANLPFKGIEKAILSHLR